jgi:hypothetical protein
VKFAFKMSILKSKEQELDKLGNAKKKKKKKKRGKNWGRGGVCFGWILKDYAVGASVP